MAGVHSGDRSDPLVDGLFSPADRGPMMELTQSHPDPISRVDSSGALRPVLLAEELPELRHHPTSEAAKSPRKVPVASAPAVGRFACFAAAAGARRNTHMRASAPTPMSRTLSARRLCDR